MVRGFPNLLVRVISITFDILSLQTVLIKGVFSIQ